ncbi:MAG: hypothetical protein QOI59_2271 [Gammaproteobacteria bacterium]|jgi:uncharacterized protein (DUF885 family)|nr:hypothetical protein [Gammaproteobacteria bacterium]
MKTALQWLGGLAGLATIAAVVLAVQSWYFRPLAIGIFFERAFIQFLLEDPEAVSSLGVFEQLGYKGFDGMLTDVSPAHEEKLARMARDDLATLRGYNRSSLSPSHQLSYDVLEWFLQDLVEGQHWLFHDYPVNQLFGVQSSTPDFMVQIHPIGDERDIHHYISRLTAFDLKFAQLLEGLRLRESKGIVPPKFVIERVLVEMRAFIAVPARENILYTNLRSKMARLRSVPAADRTRLLAEAAAAIEQKVYPAYGRIIDFFTALQPKVTEDYGVWKLPDGDGYYDHLIRSHTTSSLDAEGVHNIGLAEVARIEKEIDGVLRSQGFPDGSIAERVTRLNASPRLQYSNDDVGRAACIADYQRYIDQIVRGLAPDFASPPQLNIKVQRVPQFKEATAPGAYADTGSLDGSRPGVFYVNLRDMRDIWKYQMRTLAYHEAVPGHQLQGVIAQRLSGVPTFRKILPFSAYDEGWAVYAERLGWEMGFENDPLDNFGRLQAEMFRAVRLVVDTGIHRKHWTREQAIAYMREKTGMSEADVVSEIERYFVMPGQALAYKIGMLKIMQLRTRAQAQLGAAFDIRQFHNVVLGSGSLPLSILEKQVDAWLERPHAATH